MAASGARPAGGHACDRTSQHRLYRIRQNSPNRYSTGLERDRYVEGRDAAIEYRGANGQYEQLPSLAADLVNRQVSVIVVVATPALFAAKAATATIPIIFVAAIDPVQSGVVASLSRPGGNITGVMVLAALGSKRLQLLHDLVPDGGVVAQLVNPTSPVTESETREAQEAARVLGIKLHVLRARTESDIETAFATLTGLRASALLVSIDPFFTNHRVQIVALAARYAIPAVYVWREFVDAGGLMSYGMKLSDPYRQVGIYAGRILKGEKPTDLPIQQAARFELVINLKTAKALGITVPVPLLGRADEVIE